jgi:hypothetical protein
VTRLQSEWYIDEKSKILVEGIGIIEVWPIKWKFVDKILFKMNSQTKGDKDFHQVKMAPLDVMDELYLLHGNQKVLDTITK